MEKKINYELEMQRALNRIESSGIRPRLLLHSCCAPCSSAVLERLTQYFDITVFYYNPNISPAEEFEKRYAEQARLISELPHVNPIRLIRGDYEPELFFEQSRGLELVPEGGERCARCFRLRLSRTAALAKAENYDYFTTTLTISPLKNAQRLNSIGLECAENFGVNWLESDFKKKNGYKRSIELSAQYGLYRQNFCGCVFSRR